MNRGKIKSIEYPVGLIDELRKYKLNTNVQNFTYIKDFK